DTDLDFSLGFPKASRFLSGSIGSIGGTTNLSMSSSSQSISMSSSLTTTTSIMSTNDILSGPSTSSTLNLEAFSSENKQDLASSHTFATSDSPGLGLDLDAELDLNNSSQHQMSLNL